MKEEFNKDRKLQEKKKTEILPIKNLINQIKYS
jgi:hypothetical protein